MVALGVVEVLGLIIRLKDNMRYSEYKKLTWEQKELHDFELALDTNKRVKETNGKVRKLELWRSMIVGALIILGVLFPYLSFIS